MLKRLKDAFLTDRHRRAVSIAVGVLIFDLVYSFYNGILGVLSGVMLFAVSAVYYLLLALMRFSAVMRAKSKRTSGERFVGIGIMLIVLSVVLSVMIGVSLKTESAKGYGTIVMITIATYTFAKITAAVVSAVRYGRRNSEIIKAVNSVRYAEISVSVLTMQQSMLVSFGDGEPSLLLNALTGAGACLFIFILGLNTVSRKGIFHMAKSKLVKANKKVADAAVGAYKATEKAVVGAYKATEKAVVGTYKRVEDGFVDSFLTRDGESVEEAKKRLKDKDNNEK